MIKGKAKKAHKGNYHLINQRNFICAETSNIEVPVTFFDY